VKGNAAHIVSTTFVPFLKKAIFHRLSPSAYLSIQEAFLQQSGIPPHISAGRSLPFFSSQEGSRSPFDE
jgi:hypothetical protein